MKCPACSCKRSKPVARKVTLHTCSKCGAVFGHCYLGESYELVKPFMARDQVEPDRLRYYDFTCCGSAGITRRHGWYDPETRLIHQVG